MLISIWKCLYPELDLKFDPPRKQKGFFTCAGDINFLPFLPYDSHFRTIKLFQCVQQLWTDHLIKV